MYISVMGMLMRVNPEKRWTSTDCMMEVRERVLIAFRGPACELFAVFLPAFTS